MNVRDEDEFDSYNNSYYEDDLQEDTYSNDMSILKDAFCGVVRNFDFKDDDSEGTVSYKRTNAKHLVSKLVAIKSYPEEKKPDNYDKDYEEICRSLRGKDTYIHQEILALIIYGYNTDKKEVPEDRLKLSNLHETLFFLKLFSDITDKETESSIINRYPDKPELLKIRKKVAVLELTEADKASNGTIGVEKPSGQPKQPVRKISSEEYLEEVFNVYDRLDSTVSELGMIRKNDSPEFVGLMATAKKLSELRDKLHISNEKVTPEQLDSEPDRLMSTLFEQTVQYIAHCKKDPKSGARRKNRLKNAYRLLNVCEAYQKKITVRNVLQDKIAESLLIGLTETEIARLSTSGKHQEAAALKLSYAKPEWRKNEVDNRIKPNSTFKALIGGAHDTFDLYHMLEKPTETYSKFCKISRSAESRSNAGLGHTNHNITRSKSMDAIKK